MKSILLPVDFSATTRYGVEASVKMARAFGGVVRLLHVAPPDPAFAHSRSWPQEVRDEMAKELKKEHDQIRQIAAEIEQEGIETKAFVVRGPIADTILHYARETEANLIVLSARRESALSQFIPGSVVKGVLRKAPCAVLVVPAYGDEADTLT